MSTILVATDLTERTAAAVQRAARLVRSQGAEWALLYVVREQASSELTLERVQQAESLLQPYAERISAEAGVEPKILVKSGKVVSATVIQAGEELNADLLVLGAHGQSGLKEFFLGTTAERVIRGTRIPVLRVARPVQGDYQKVLAAFDLSPVSIAAVREAHRLSLLDLQDFDLAYAAELLPIGGMAEVVPDANVIEGLLEEARTKVRAALQEAGLEVPEQRVHVLDGDPHQVLNEVLDETGAGLLVLGTRGRTAVKRLVLGSVASALLTGLHVDVLVVPGRDA